MTRGQNSVDPEVTAHYELPHLNICCLQIQLFSFSAVYVLYLKIMKYFFLNPELSPINNYRQLTHDV